MTKTQALKELKALGDEKTRALNTKWGAPKKQFGVKMGDIRKVAKKAKTDHDLALALWKDGTVEAQLLATLVCKPKELSAKELDGWVRSTVWHRVADWCNSYVVKKHPDAESLREEWMKDKNIWAARAGWNLTSILAAKGGDGLDLKKTLDRLDKQMGKAKPEVQWTMNFALAEIGINHPKLRKRAVAIGEKHGLYRDYPVAKGCTSPFAPIWIAEMVKRQG